MGLGLLPAHPTRFEKAQFVSVCGRFTNPTPWTRSARAPDAGVQAILTRPELGPRARFPIRRRRAGSTAGVVVVGVYGPYTHPSHQPHQNLILVRLQNLKVAECRRSPPKPYIDTYKEMAGSYLPSERGGFRPPPEPGNITWTAKPLLSGTGIASGHICGPRVIKFWSWMR